MHTSCALLWKCALSSLIKLSALIKMDSCSWRNSSWVELAEKCRQIVTSVKCVSVIRTSAFRNLGMLRDVVKTSCLSLWLLRKYETPKLNFASRLGEGKTSHLHLHFCSVHYLSCLERWRWGSPWRLKAFCSSNSLSFKKVHLYRFVFFPLQLKIKSEKGNEAAR